MALPANAASEREAALLRAMTDLYCRAGSHDGEAQRRYEELATFLLPRVDEESRAQVAGRLADQADAPKAVLRLLARDTPAVAEPVLLRARRLSAADLVAIVAATGPAHHRLIARRPDLPAEVRAALQPAPAPSPMSLDDVLAILELPPAGPAPQPSPWEAFLALAPSERLAAIADAAAHPQPASAAERGNRLGAMVDQTYRATQLMIAARDGGVLRMTEELAALVDLPVTAVRAALRDESGEAAVILLAAAGIALADARTLLLLAHEASRRAPETFFRLADLLAGLERRVAEAIVAGWRTPAADDAPAAPALRPRLRPSAGRRAPAGR